MAERELARLVVVHHRCGCASATEPPGEHGVEHVFTIDGVEFPWAISEHGPRVYRVCENLYQIDVTILASAVEVDGIEISDRHDAEEIFSMDDLKDTVAALQRITWPGPLMQTPDVNPAFL